MDTPGTSTTTAEPRSPAEPAPCYISLDHVRPLMHEKEGTSEEKMRKLRDEVAQILAGGMQSLAEDLMECAVQVAQGQGRDNVCAEDVDASLANALFKY